MNGHPLSFLALLLSVGLAFLLWNLLSVKKNQKTGGDTTGIGGPNDPLS